MTPQSLFGTWPLQGLNPFTVVVNLLASSNSEQLHRGQTDSSDSLWTTSTSPLQLTSS